MWKVLYIFSVSQPFFNFSEFRQLPSGKSCPQHRAHSFVYYLLPNLGPVTLPVLLSLQYLQMSLFSFCFFFHNFWIFENFLWLLNKKFHLKVSSYFLLHVEQMKGKILPRVHQLPKSFRKIIVLCHWSEDIFTVQSVRTEWDNLGELLSEFCNNHVSLFVLASIKLEPNFDPSSNLWFRTLWSVLCGKSLAQLYDIICVPSASSILLKSCCIACIFISHSESIW